MTERDPVEIAEEAITDTHDIDVQDIHYARNVIRALEAAGFVIVHPDGITKEMAIAWADYWSDNYRDGSVFKDTPARTAIEAILSAAPKWSKGREG